MKRLTSLAILAICAAVVLLIGYSVAEDRRGGRTEDDHGGRSGMHHMTSTAPGTMMCDMKTCQEHMAKIEQAIKSLDSAKQASDKGDAKAASADLDKAAALLKDVQGSMKKMMGQVTTAAAGQPDGVKVVNIRCPIKGLKIDPNNVPDVLTREYKGQKIGFCCAGCPAAWDKLSNDEKDKKLADAMKP